MSVRTRLSIFPIDLLAGKKIAFVPIPVELLISATAGRDLYPLPIESIVTSATGPFAVGEVVVYESNASFLG